MLNVFYSSELSAHPEGPVSEQLVSGGKKFEKGAADGELIEQLKTVQTLQRRDKPGELQKEKRKTSSRRNRLYNKPRQRS